MASNAKTPDKLTGPALNQISADRLKKHKDILMDFCYNEMESHAKTLQEYASIYASLEG